MRSSLLALCALLAIVLTGCSSPAARAVPDAFAGWAAGQEHVVSVDAEDAATGLVAHLVVDGAIEAPGLLDLVDAVRAETDSLGADATDVNIIVGNAWGFSLDPDGINVATINTLRENPLLVGATIGYEPIDPPADYVGGLHATVGSQAGLRDAPAALLAAYTDAGGSLDGVPVAVATGNGGFGIVGVGTEQPAAAIALWQAVSGRVLPLSAVATVAADGTQSLDLLVGSADEQAVAEGIGAEHPDVVLTVSH